MHYPCCSSHCLWACPAWGRHDEPCPRCWFPARAIMEKKPEDDLK